MSWYCISPAHYIVLISSTPPLPAAASSSSSSLSLPSIPATPFPSSVKPSDIRDQLIGTRVGLGEPFNVVKYVSKRNKVFLFQVVEVSCGSRSSSTKPTTSNDALVSRMTQVFLVKSKNERVYSFSSNAQDWRFVSPYSQEDAAIAVRLHDPCIVSTLLGNSDCDYLPDLTSMLSKAIFSYF